MFENYFRDVAFQQYNSETAKTIDRMHAKKWRPAVPEGVPEEWRPPGYKPPKRGRSPVHTRFKRLPETAEKDREALGLRLAGLKYREIAEFIGYHSRQAAHVAVKRARRDQLTAQSHVDKPSRARPSTRPDAS